MKLESVIHALTYERDEVLSKINRIEDMLLYPKSKNVPQSHLDLIYVQSSIYDALYNILDARIDDLKKRL